jgi:hypothetical protein
MKRMTIRYLDGPTATKAGRRILLSKANPINVPAAGESYLARASSTEVQRMIEREERKGRARWAQLLVELDGVALAFWLPEELQMYCDVFVRKPFPTALTLTRESRGSHELNTHWLSRLPKKAKAAKFRHRFLRYVSAEPPVLMEFYRFYSRYPN